MMSTRRKLIMSCSCIFIIMLAGAGTKAYNDVEANFFIEMGKGFLVSLLFPVAYFCYWYIYEKGK